MSNNLISVIVPVYNVEKYLRECLDSILNQTHKNLEVICIDDGSKDDSLSILNEYAAKDSRVIVIPQKNAGAGAARNRGIAEAKGDYLSFLDSDDFFEKDMLERAYTKIEKTDADFVLYDSKEYLMDANKFIVGPISVNKELLPMNMEVFTYQDIKGCIFRSMIGWAWDKLFKADFVRENNLHFLEQHNSEDLYFTYSALIKARKIAVVPKVLAYRRIRPGESLSASRTNHWDDYYTALIELRKVLVEAGVYEELERSYITFSLHLSLWNLHTLKGKAFESLFTFLKEEGFEELGVKGKELKYFYSAREYDRYLGVMEKDVITYLQEETEAMRESITRILRKLPFGLGSRGLDWYIRRRNDKI